MNKTKSKPNVILIYTDDQGYGDVSALNSQSKIKTPNIDKLADEGLNFRDGHCSDTVCTPSRYGLLTGRYSWRTELKSGVMGAEGKCLIEDGRLTLPLLFKKHGYKTAMIGKWHLGMQFDGKKGKRNWDKPVKDGPIDKGFDYFYGIPASMNFGILTYIENNQITEAPTLWTAKKENKNAINDFRFKPPYEKKYDLNEYEYIKNHPIEVAPHFKDSKVLSNLTNKALNWLDLNYNQRNNNAPFFLYLSYTSPHKPVCPKEEFRRKSKAGWYGDFIEETDYYVGRIINSLDDYGEKENTIVIFTSDNGPETTYQKRKKIYNHHSSGIFKGGKRDLYEGGHRVPFIVNWPNVIEEGRICDKPVCQTDFLATFAEMLGENLSDEEGEDSFSIYKSFISKDFSGSLRGPIIHHSSKGYFAIRENKWKLNMIKGSGGSLLPQYVEPSSEEFPFELYNLDEDIKESNNIIKEFPEKADCLKEKITKIVKNGRSTPGISQKNDGPEWWPQLTWLNNK